MITDLAFKMIRQRMELLDLPFRQASTCAEFEAAFQVLRASEVPGMFPCLNDIGAGFWFWLRLTDWLRGAMRIESELITHVCGGDPSCGNLGEEGGPVLTDMGMCSSCGQPAIELAQAMPPRAKNAAELYAEDMAHFMDAHLGRAERFEMEFPPASQRNRG